MVCLSVLDIKKFKEGVDKNNKSYEMYDVSVQQEDTKAQYKASLFVYRGSPVPKVGTQIEADVVKKDKYTNINKWREMGVKKEVEVFKGTKELPKPGDVIQVKEPLAGQATYPTNALLTKNTEKMWSDKEKREHKRALTMQAFSLFPPITNESEETAMDRWLKVKDMRDCMLTDLYND